MGTFHVAVFVLLGGKARGRLPFMLVAAILGAYGGQALGARLGDPMRIGDFGLLAASVTAWIGIAIVAVASTLGPTREEPRFRRRE